MFANGNKTAFTSKGVSIHLSSHLRQVGREFKASLGYSKTLILKNNNDDKIKRVRRPWE